MPPRSWISGLAVLILSATTAGAELAIDKIQMCYGPFGPERKSADLAPHDTVWFRFDIRGTRVDADGQCDASVRVQVADAQGKSLFDTKTPAKGVLALGGNLFPASAHVTFSDRPPPGEYTFMVTVTDHLSKESASFERKLTARETGLAIVGPEFFYDADAKVAAPAGGLLGQTLHLRCKAVDFDCSQGKIDIEMKLQVLDSQGQETMPKPSVVAFKLDKPEEAKKVGAVDFKAFLSLNRAGKFMLRISVSDRIGKKTAHFETPLNVGAR